MNIEIVLKGLAFSNFYLKCDEDDDPKFINIAIDSMGTCHIGPSEGTLRFECSSAASAYPVASVSSDAAGVIRVYTSRGEQRAYQVHQKRDTLPALKFEPVSIDTYRELQGKR